MDQALPDGWPDAHAPPAPDAAPHDFDAEQRVGRWIAGERHAGDDRRASPDRRAISDRRNGVERRKTQVHYDGPERRSGGERRSGTERRSGADRRAGERREAGWRGAGSVADLEAAPNRYGLASRSQSLYPQAYQPMDTQWWQGLTEEQRAEAMRLQATAQERVGFERDAPKFFIGDVQVEGMLGPGEKPPPAALEAQADADYELKRKAAERRKRELEEVAQGKRKRVNRFTAQQDESNCYVLGLPSVVAAAGPAIIAGAAVSSDMLPEVAHPMQSIHHAPNEPGGDSGYIASSGEGLIGSAGNVAPAQAGSGADRRVNQTPYSGPERRSAAGALARPGPDYGHQQAGGAGKQKLAGKVAQIDSGNVYGLASKSELNFPTAYAPVSREMWAELSAEQQAEIMRTQAMAQEKVGYEKHTTKYFIEDFDPSNPNAPTIAPHAAPALGNAAGGAAANSGGASAPRLLLGGVLIGAGGLGVALALVGSLPLMPGAAVAAVAVLGGAVLAGTAWG